MADLTPQATGYVGTNITFQAAGITTGFDIVPRTGDRIFLWVKSTSVATRTVTIAVDGTTFEQANPDVAVSIPPSEERMMGPLNAGLATVAAGGGVLVTYSNLAGLTVAAVEVSTPPADLP